MVWDEKEDEWEEDSERLEGNPIDVCVCVVSLLSFVAVVCVAVSTA